MAKDADNVAYSYIRKAIIDRVLLPNEQIVEQQVAEKTGISRTPIRNALKKLSYEGMIVLRPNRGAFVVNPSHQEVRDTFECKLIVETEAVRLASMYITEEELDQAEAVLAKAMKYHESGVFDHFIDLNYEFHMIIAKASHSTIYEKYVHELTTLGNVHLLVYDDFRDVPLEEMESFKEHRRLIEALHARDENRCAEAIIGHTLNTYYTLNLSLPLRTTVQGKPLLLAEGKAPAKSRSNSKKRLLAR